jgi:hypothetical protein
VLVPSGYRVLEVEVDVTHGEDSKHASGGSNGPHFWLRVFKHFIRQSRQDSRGLVVMGERASEIASLAKELALSGREDQAAVAELVTAAGGDSKALNKAFQNSRVAGYQHEDKNANRAWRLLAAACAGGPVPPPSEDDRARMDSIDAFRALPDEDRWAYLLAREPRLGKLEEEVGRGIYGNLALDDHSGQVTSRIVVTKDGQRLREKTLHLSPSSSPRLAKEELPAAREDIRRRLAFQNALSQIVGPKSGHRDVVMNSSAAVGAAGKYLRLKAPA